MAAISIQSFGGGSSTFFLIHQASIERGWLTEEEFVRAWALVQVAPGINLVKLTAWLGYGLRGWPGLFVAMAGLLLPSAAVTVLMTAGFAAIRGRPAVQAALRGIVPATIGLSLAMAVQMAQPLLTRARREGPVQLGGHLAVVATAGLLLAVWGVSPLTVLLLSGAAIVVLAAGCKGIAHNRPEEEPSTP